MKRMTLIAAMMITGSTAIYAQSTTPVYLDNTSPVTTNVYAEHGQQGNEMFQNNSQWYNKDNTPPNSIAPSSNAQYNQPGNSNPLNNQMYNGNTSSTPAGSTYDYGLPVQNSGSSPSGGSDTYVRP